MDDKFENLKSIIHIEDLCTGSVSGVLEVSSFSPAEIALKISSGNMEIKGASLEVKSFNVETGDLTFAGEITSFALAKTKTSLFQRLTK
ncbi:MAG: YabP/YqfC family sporulation protein [Bacillota bacterium]